MDLLIAILAWLSAGFALAVASYWGVAAHRVWKSLRTVPTARAGLALAQDWPDHEMPEVRVVIPAHNEEQSIATVARSLMIQDYPNLRVIFCLDRCTDATRTRLQEALSGDARAEIIEIDSCPTGVAGKVNAIEMGVAHFTNTLPDQPHVLLFVDADTELRPDCIRATVAMLRRLPRGGRTGLDMLSLLSELNSTRWFEKLVQPAASLELVRQYPIERANDDEDRRPFANGQFIMFDSDAYRRIGGHSRVHAAVLEDVELSRVAHAEGLRCGLFLSDGLLKCRMYNTWHAFEKGWRRIYTECANRKPSRLKKLALRVPFVGALLPLAAAGGILFAVIDATTGLGFTLPSIVAGIAGAAAITLWLGVIAAIYRAGNTPVWCTIGYPIGTLILARILWRAARDLETGTPTEWAGMTYVRPAR